MNEVELVAAPVFELGPLSLTSTVLTTWAIMAIIWLFAVLFVWGFLGARRLLLPRP